MGKSIKFFAGAAIVLPAAIALAPSAARATPYAFASNQITGLTITYADGSSISAVTSATTLVGDGTTFTGSAVGGSSAAGVVGAALTIPQAYSGPGTAPVVSYNPLGAGSFTGTRADASIGAGSASSGGVAVSNVAEGYGAAVGNSTGNNSASITFTVTGTGSAITVSFTDLAQLIASSAGVTGETANATIANTFSVVPESGTATPVTFAPPNLNQHLSSSSGVPPTDSFDNSSFYTFTTPVLTLGTTYNVSLSSASVENIQPGTSTPVPEPATLGLLGAGLLGLGFASRRKRG